MKAAPLLALADLPRLLESCTDKRLRDWVLWTAHTGARPIELAHLRWYHVDLGERALYVPNLKTRASLRYVPLSDQLLRWCEERLGLRDNTRALILRPCSTLSRQLAETGQRIGLARLTLMALRRSVAVWHRSAGVPEDEVARRLGLESPPFPLSRAQMDRVAGLLVELQVAQTTGTPLEWGDARRRQWTRLLERVGVFLVSRTAAGKKGHVVKRCARPVVEAYFGAPLQRHTELFLLGMQTRAIAPDARPSSPRVRL